MADHLPHPTAEDAAYDRGRDSGLEDGGADERHDIVEWLKRIKPADLALQDDSTPMTVLFVVREAIERGDHQKMVTNG